MPSAQEAVIGYYRFTDIFFEWHKALPNQEDIGPLKALLAYQALVHPDHPLRSEGSDGLEFHLGTFESGEMRLLVSSAQVEYIRYWLHAMQLTKEPIPIPSSDYLIRHSDLTNCSPSVYNDAAVLKKAIKVRARGRGRRARRGARLTSPQTIEKNNKRIKGAPSLLTNRRINFEKIRTIWVAKVGTWLAIDFEAWDRDHSMITEYGWSLVRWEGKGDEKREVTEDGHLIVREYRGFHQTYVEENRDHYNFGQSEDVDKHTFRQRIRDMLAKYREMGPLFLVFHDNNQDVKYLRDDSIKALTDFEYLLPDQAPESGVYVIDTGDLFAALEGEGSGNKRSLERACRHLQIPTEFLHNAGNDAHYTLAAMIAMASGDTLDVQREKRWPNRTSSINTKVEFMPWEEDSEDDLESMMPGNRATMQINGEQTMPDPDGNADLPDENEDISKALQNGGLIPVRA
ncbi:uncharacterized protein B0H18DRAFT_965939 [Fomitopsis serialis]|uniref:uncharacterized protein n=1 Tax=Fomitopsis serialis TaxID=139415 RepID=UPI002008CC39|nr:uncharacterized protein B0H18DRAFT_965939 [Neoantrodia serialis]KAH9938180.1 hypothetical protein B0H18DRAFT_965939 [Neoantrodia serialis]